MSPKNQIIADAFKSIREFLNEQQIYFDNLEERIDNLKQEQTRFHVVEKILEIQVQQQEMISVIENITAKFAQLQTNFYSFKEHTDYLERQQTYLKAELTAEFKQHQTDSDEKFTQKLEQQQTLFYALEKQIENLNARQTHFAVLETQIGDLNQEQTRQDAKYIEKLALLETQIGDLKPEQTRPDTKYIEKLALLETQIGDLKPEQTRPDAKYIEKLKQPINKLENNFKDALVRLTNLEFQLNDTEVRTQNIAEILPNAISQAIQLHEKNTKTNIAELSEFLQEPVEQNIRKSIIENTRSFADALFPAMGPAIRKSINESFKVIIQRLNKTLEESFSPKGIAWRLQSLLTGQPFSDIVLQHTLVFEVEQVFLMHRESGLLIQHLHKDEVEVGDSDAVSAMFTAIQDFVRDSFVSNADSAAQRDLNTVEVGERTVWLEHGPHAVLACVIRGNAPVSFRNLMQSLLETMHARYGLLLQEFSGDNQQLQSCRFILQKAFHSETKSKPTNWRLQLFRVGGILGVILLFLLVWSYYSFKYQQRLNNYINVLQNAPGIVVVSTKYKDGKLVIYGMRDPLADDPREIAQRHNLNNNVESSWTPYQDLTTQFVEQRVLQQLVPPSTVSVHLQDSVLYIKGYASKDWIARAKASLVTGVQRVETDELIEIDSFLLALAVRKLAPPENVTLKVHERVLQVGGYVNSTTRQALLKRIHTLPITPATYAKFDTSALLNAKAEKKKLIQSIKKIKIYFRKDSTEFIPKQKIALQALYKKTQQLQALCQALHQSLHLQIIGDTDGLGEKIHNQQLAQKRAQIIWDLLYERGIHNLIITEPPVIRFGESKPNPNNRNVSFKISIKK